MSERPKVAKIDATVNNGEYSAEGMTVQMSINTIPTVRLRVGRRNAKLVTAPVTQDVLDDIRDRQQRRLAGRDEPDVKISASDAVGGDIFFSGYMSAPVLETSKSSTSDQFTALGTDAALDGLDLSVYQVNSVDMRADENDDGLQPLPSSTTGDVPRLMSEITEALLRGYDAALQREENVDMRKLIEAQHTINTRTPLYVWKAILANSDAVYPAWALVAKDSSASDYLGRTMSQRTMQMLCQRSSGFWSVVNNLMASYQMFYRPSASGSGGLFLNDRKVGKPSRTVQISPRVLNVSDGSSRILQPGGVVMVAAAVTSMRPDENKSSPSIAAQYPEVLRAGYIHRDVPPAWLLNADGSPILGSSLERPTDGDVNLSLEAYAARKDTATEYNAGLDTKRTAIMNDLCRVIFEDLQLADSTAMLQLPLDLSVTVGERLTFELKGGGSFEGFVSGLQHSVDLRQGKELDSFTQLTLTHVRY